MKHNIRKNSTCRLNELKPGDAFRVHHWCEPHEVYVIVGLDPNVVPFTSDYRRKETVYALSLRDDKVTAFTDHPGQLEVTPVVATITTGAEG